MRREDRQVRVLPSSEEIDKMANMAKSVTNPYRADAWVNVATGLGIIETDKSVASYFVSDYRLTDTELSSLYHNSDLARKIIRLRPEEMFRVGYDVEVEALPDPDGDVQETKPGKKDDEGVEPEDPEDAPEDSDDPAERLERMARMLHLDEKLLEAMSLARLYGGALLFLGVEDGKDPSKPLDDADAKDIKFLTIFDRREAITHKFYDDPMAPSFGEPEQYVLYPQFHVGEDGKQSISGKIIHESRCIRFGGAPTDRRERLKLWGWDYSVLQAVYPVVRDFENVIRSMAYMVQDANQSVFKIAGLMEQIAAGGAEVQARMRLVEQTRAVNRAVLLDADEQEDFVKNQTTFQGVPDIVDRFQQRLSAATEIPVTLLMGRSPAGLNATGESDLTVFYNAVARDQQNILLPVLLRVYRILAKGLKVDPKLVRIVCRPLVEMTEKEKAELELLHAQKDKLNIDSGVLTPEEVCLSRFADPEEFGLKIRLSQESINARHESLDLALENPDFSGTNEAKGLGPDGKPLPPPPGAALPSGSANPRQARSGRVPAGSTGSNKPRANTKGPGRSG